MEQREMLSRKGCFRTLFAVFVCMIFIELYWTIFQTGVTGVFITNSQSFDSGRHRIASLVNTDSTHILLESVQNFRKGYKDQKRVTPDIHRNILIRNTSKAQDLYGNNGSFLIRNTDEKYMSKKQTINWENDSIFDNITCRSDRRITSCIYSKVKLLHINAHTRTIEAGIYLYDGYNNAKSNGGDVILMWAERIPSGGRAPGHVTDHMNGTYSGIVHVHWSGQTKIFVKLASAKENVCLRFKAMKKYGDSVYAVKTPYDIYYRFVHLSSIEYTRCSPQNFVYGYNSLCNFTSLNGGLSWFCGEPTKKGLHCSSFKGFQMKPYVKRKLVPKQPADEVINENGHCVFKEFLHVVIDPDNGVPSKEKAMNFPKCSERPTKDSWLEQRPTGYIMNQTWIFNNCQRTIEYNSKSLNKCLSGKKITFIGDSTLRQYLETIAGIMKIKINSPDGFSETAYSAKFDIHISWRKHEMPFHNIQLFKQQGVQSSTFQLSKLANARSIYGKNSIVVVHYGSHLQAFPPDVYRSRLQSLTRALKQLLAKKPDTKIFVKGAAPVIATSRSSHVKCIRYSFSFVHIYEAKNLHR